MEQRNACRAIEMKLPAEKDMLLVVRLTASGILTRCGAMLDVMDDFKIAVEEACSLLIAQTESGGELHLRFEMAPGRASFEAHCQGKCVSGAESSPAGDSPVHSGGAGDRSPAGMRGRRGAGGIPCRVLGTLRWRYAEYAQKSGGGNGAAVRPSMPEVGIPHCGNGLSPVI